MPPHRQAPGQGSVPGFRCALCGYKTKRSCRPHHPTIGLRAEHLLPATPNAEFRRVLCDDVCITARTWRDGGREYGPGRVLCWASCVSPTYELSPCDRSWRCRRGRAIRTSRRTSTRCTAISRRVPTACRPRDVPRARRGVDYRPRSRGRFQTMRAQR